ncbi:MAG: UDP-galactopyranose mutase [Nanoarchaeota archaeon]|nr:UDP-galactopyranose mutase [Nanoarchaeota archaeon]
MGDKKEILVVGAGITGLTIAERIANVLGKEVLVIDKRNHIGGNCFDFYNKHGILIPLYGPHIFHTDYEEVINYLDNFTDWYPYEHKVLSSIDGKTIVPIPVNIETVNKIFNKEIKNAVAMEKWLEKNTPKIDNPKNSEESAISRIGKELYELLIKNYTKKQWDLWPHELGPEVLNRLPVRPNFNDHYFSDKYQGMPKNGYTKMFENMIKNKKIKILLNTDFFKLKQKFGSIIFTGKVDDYFKNNGLNELQYRALKFEFETYNKEFFQNSMVVNYPNTEEFTRITENKHATGQRHHKTTIIKEYPGWEGEPSYPVFSEQNKKLYLEYEKLAKQAEKENIFFLGRLAEFKYLDMDDAFKNSLDFFEKKIK